MSIVLIATIRAKAEFRDEIKTACEQMVKPSVADRGCEAYRLHLNTKDANEFVFYEVWQDASAIEAHNQSAHFQKFLSEIDGKCESVEIKELELI